MEASPERTSQARAIPPPSQWAVVVLNWNGRADTLECLASLEALAAQGCDVICVDNGSTDGSVEAIRSAFPGVEVIAAGANLGYAGGNNLGIRRALSAGADWIVLVNNDAIVSPDVIDGFRAALERRPDAGILAGKVYFRDRPSTIWFAGQRVSLLAGYAGKPRGYGESDDSRYGDVVEVGRAVGALMAISRETLEDAGLLDEDLFAYVEDVDLCVRARACGHPVVFAPGARAWHAVSAATGGEGASTHTIYYGVRNTIAVCERHLPLPRVAAGLRRLVVLSTFGLYSLRRKNRRPALYAAFEGYRDARRGNWGARPVDAQ